MAFTPHPPRDGLFPSWVGAGIGFGVKVTCSPPSPGCGGGIPGTAGVVPNTKRLSQSLPRGKVHSPLRSSRISYFGV